MGIVKISNLEKKEIVSLYQKGYTLKETGKLLNYPYQTVSKILIKENIPRRKIGRLCKNKTLLNKVQKQIIDGLLLGDGSVLVGQNSKTAHLRFATTEQVMANHIAELLPFNMKICKIPSSKRLIKQREYNCKESYQVYSPTDLSLNNFRHTWYPNGKKIIPKNLVLSPISVKYWFFGDGCSDIKTRYGRYPAVRITFSTNGFSFEDCEILAMKLNHQCGFKFNVNKNRNKPILTSSKKETIKNFYNYIDECNVSCYQYKWKTVL